LQRNTPPYSLPSPKQNPLDNPVAEYWIVDVEEQKIIVCQWVDGAYEDAIAQGREYVPSVVIADLILTFFRWDRVSPLIYIDLYGERGNVAMPIAAELDRHQMRHRY
jgi:hypothetical protein